MKKGFTLVELLAVIILLAIIALIAYPTLNSVISNNKDKLYDKQIKELERHANTWVTGNVESFVLEDGDTYLLTFEELYNYGLIQNKEVKDPRNSGNIPGCIAVTANGLNYVIKYEEKCIYIDKSGANAPELLDNMIPIKYENNQWVYADIYSKWYDYGNKEWANAVVLNSGVTKTVGQTISENDIALWYVWIPRYKYQLFNVDNERVTEKLINIEFEKRNKTTGTVRCTDAINRTDSDGNVISEICTNAVNGNWYTHPAFTFGNQELTGFWIGKFEISTTNEECNTTSNVTNCDKVSTVTIKPNTNSWRNTQVVNFYESIQNMSSTYNINNADSHMIKNMEWGAVAYLKQSKYGLGLTDIGINNNEDYITGCGAAAESDSSEECSPYDTTSGMLASTTGNIYGVYDMSGGSFEYTMGNMVDDSGKFYPSSSDFKTTPEAKYYDKYSNSDSELTHTRGKLGDGTRETLKTFVEYYGGWYDDFGYFPSSMFSWFLRGGQFDNGSYDGVFHFNGRAGNANTYYSSRAILVRK